MAKFEFTIAAGDLGTNDPSTATTFTADRGLSRASNNRVLTAKFGEGYEQRTLDGINTKNDTFNLTFNNRSADDINMLAAFFDVKASKSFNFTVTDHVGDTTMKVVCESYNINYHNENFHNLSCSFRRVYEP